MAAGGSTKAVVAAMAANGAIATAKFVAAALTGSASMFSEGIHSVADTGNQGLLLWGGRDADQPADATFQYGRSRARYFWSFVVAIVLFLLGGVYALYEGYEKVAHPHEVENLGIAIGVLVFGIVVEGLSFRTAIRIARPLKGERGWFDFVRQTREPELSVVLLEDLGAMAGLTLALVAVSLAAITGDPVWDGIGTLSIGILLTVISILLTIEMRSLLLGEAATPKDEAAIEAAIRSTDGIDQLLHLRTQHLGPDDVLVSGKVVMHQGLDFDAVCDTINRAEAAVRDVVPAAHMIYLEPGRQLADHEIPLSDHGPDR